MNKTTDGGFERSFWENLGILSENDKKQFLPVEPPIISRDEVISRIEDVIVEIVHQISTGTAPEIKIRHRKSWKNCVYIPDVGIQLDECASLTAVSLSKETSVEKFGLALKVMSMIYNLLRSEKTATKRDMFYEEQQMFRSQLVLDQLVDEIACMLKVPRRMLNVLATSKGCVVGDLTFTDGDGSVVNCEENVGNVAMVPSQVDKIEHLHSEKARFVLVVEKDATFQRLLDDGFVSSMPCIMITGKGVPDVSTRLMIRKLWNALKLPVLGLMDADPHGIEIFCVYKFGSMSQSYDPSLALPFMRWLGVFPSDISRLRLPEDAIIPFTQKDDAKCRDLLVRPYMEHFPRLEEEIGKMHEAKTKAEIQALTKISGNYLSNVFIPSKIKHGEWI